MTRKALYKVFALKNGEYAIRKSGKTIARVLDIQAAEYFLMGWTGLQKLPEGFHIFGFYA